MKYSSASSAMLEHRYPGMTSYGAADAGAGSYDLLGDRVASEMFGGSPSHYRTLPVAAGGAVQLQPAVAAGIDTGTVHLVPLDEPPGLTPGAELGVEIGFAEFLKEHRAR